MWSGGPVSCISGVVETAHAFTPGNVATMMMYEVRCTYHYGTKEFGLPLEEYCADVDAGEYEEGCVE